MNQDISMIIAVRSEVARSYKVSPTVAKNCLLQLTVGLCFGIIVAMLGEHWVALLLFFIAPAIARLTILRGQLARNNPFVEFYKTNIKAAAAPFEMLLNEHDGAVLTTHMFGSSGPIVNFKAPTQIARYLDQILRRNYQGKSSDITYIWKVSASFSDADPERFVWCLASHDRRLDALGDHFAFDAAKLTDDFKSMAIGVEKLIAQNLATSQ